eukprot:3322407-Prymnesium_polylepis.2
MEQVKPTVRGALWAAPCSLDRTSCVAAVRVASIAADWRQSASRQSCWRDQVIWDQRCGFGYFSRRSRRRGRREVRVERRARAMGHGAHAQSHHRDSIWRLGRRGVHCAPQACRVRGLCLGMTMR